MAAFRLAQLRPDQEMIAAFRRGLDTPREVRLARAEAALAAAEALLPPPKSRKRVSEPLVDEDGTRWSLTR